MGPYSSIAGLIQSLLQGKKQTDPIANYEQDFGMGGGSLNNIGAGPDIRQGPDIPNYRQPHSLYPDQIGIVPQEYLRASQRRGYVPDINPYDFTGIPGGGQSDKSIESPDAVAGAENAAIEAKILADQNKEGLGPNYGAHGWHDFAIPELGSMGPPRGGGNMVGLGDYQDRFNIAEDERIPTASPSFTERDMLANAGENRDLLRLGQARAPVMQRPTAHPSMAGIPPTFGMRRPGTSFDANIEVGGRPGGWFTPEEYGRNYYKFGRGA